MGKDLNAAPPALGRRGRTRLEGDTTSQGHDELPVEAPLTIRAAGETIATTMRTPGADHALTAGFLFAEGLIDGAADIGRITHCGDVEDQAAEHTVDVTAGPGFVFRLEGVGRRGTLSHSSCGVCGRERIDDLVERIRMRPYQARFGADDIRRALRDLHAGQTLFARTGSIHGAALFDAQGGRLALSEDIGRHNAIDKVVGRLLLDDQLGEARLLALSGRISFEVVQKAAAARIAMVVTHKGASTFAVDLAQELGVTLCAFVRDERLSIYGAQDAFAAQVPGTASIVR